MKAYNIAKIIILILIFQSCTKPIESRFVLKDGNNVSPDLISKNRLTGTLFQYYKSGELLSLTQFKNGIKNGLEIEYFKNGFKSYIYQYVDGKKNGILVEYYKSGNIQNVGPYSNDKLNGHLLSFYDSTIYICSSNMFFFNNQRMAESFFFSKNGTLNQYSFKNSNSETAFTSSYNKYGMVLETKGILVIETEKSSISNLKVGDVFKISSFIARPPGFNKEIITKTIINGKTIVKNMEKRAISFNQEIKITEKGRYKTMIYAKLISFDKNKILKDSLMITSFTVR